MSIINLNVDIKRYMSIQDYVFSLEKTRMDIAISVIGIEALFNTTE